MQKINSKDILLVISIISVFTLLCPASFIGFIFFICLGLFLIWQCFRCNMHSWKKECYSKRNRILSLFLSFLFSASLSYFFFLRWMSANVTARISHVLSISPRIFLIFFGAIATVGSSFFFYVLFERFLASADKCFEKPPSFPPESDSFFPSEISLSEKTLLFLCAAGTVTFCSRSSPLYPLNNWGDVNCFFTVGKSMFHGLVPYRDLFEQKGPLLYFLYGLTWFISNDSFFGGYLLEIISAFFFLLYSYKTTCIFIKRKCIFLFPATAFLTYTCWAFEQGGSAEELCLPILSWSLWLIFQGFSKNRYSYQDLIFLGLAAGCVFWIKFTLVGLYIGWFIWFSYDAIKRGYWKDIFHAAYQVTLGIILATIPWLLYFGINHSIKDWLRVYLYDNLFIYSLSADSNMGVLSGIPLLKSLLDGVYSCGLYNHVILLLYAICFVNTFIHRQSRLAKLLLLLLFNVFFFIYIGGRQYRYYSLVLAIFIAPSLALICLSFPELRRCFNSQAAVILSVILCLYGSFLITPNRYFLRFSKTDLAQYQFKEIIDKDDKNATILNYGFLDGGFYTVCNTFPNCKAFCGLNIPLDELKDLQKHFVDNGLCDYIITRTYVGDEEYFELNLYTCIAKCDSDYSWGERTYRLYKLIDTPSDS